jgi:C-terminal processing protease CtpA/Prc
VAAAHRIGALLRARERAGDYRAIHDDTALAQRLSSDLLQASHDAHLRVTPRTALPWWRRLRDPAGIDSYTKIAADIGYIDVTSFVAPDRSARRYARAFGKLADTRTLIIDLRNNEGGDADGLQLLASYVVDRPIQYASLARRDGSNEARWAFPQLAARPYLEQVLILIGPRTSMEAENFAFAMQAWKRAAVVGSRSAGLATARRAYPIADFLAVHIPDARVTLPLTRTDWPGGVVPDLATRGDALREAKRHIFQDRLAHVTTPMGRAALLALLKEL